MKTEVVYYSRTGNTEKIAKAMASVLGVEPKNVRKDIIVKDFDLLFIGSGVYGSRPGNEIMDFANFLKDVKGKKAVIFGTFGDNIEPLKTQIGTILESKGMDVIDAWGCKGRSFIFFNRGKPSREDIKQAKEFTGKLINKEH